MGDRLLVRHFLRRFIDNDLISPDADRHEALAVMMAALLMGTLFLAVLLSTRYLFRPLQSRGFTAFVSLQDAFIWCGLSMIVMAIVAVVAWNGLALDSRDTEVLGVLPVARARIVGAQLAAVVILGLGLLVCVNAIPTLLAPIVRVSRLPISGPGVARLVAAHAGATMAAGLFGFLTVIAIRETLRAVLVGAWFDRISPVVQGLLLAGLASCMLLLPALSGELDRRWLSGPAATAPPPVWFVGLHERLVGTALIDLPPTDPPADAPAAAAIRAFEAGMMHRYQSRRATLASLADVSIAWLAGIGIVAAIAWAWNSRRWPEAARPSGDCRGVVIARIDGAVERLVARRPAERAGFTFAREALTRSLPHRVWLAATLGAAVAAAAFSLPRAPFDPSPSIAHVPLAAFAMQTLVLVIMTTGYRLATRVPADVRGGLTFEIVGFEAATRFVEGVKRAGVVLVGCPVIALLWPIHAHLLGTAVASVHAMLGVLILLPIMEAAFFRAPDLPFVSPRERDGNVPAIVTLHAVMTIAGAMGMAALERLALGSTGGTITLAVALIGAWGTLAAVNRRGSAFHELGPGRPPAEATQRLGLIE